MDWLKKYDNIYLLLGRILLGLYFLVFGALKVPTYFDTLSLMISKGVPLSSVLLPITIIVQVLAGFFFNYWTKSQDFFSFAGWTNIPHKHIHS
jgi:uncharacterized membrane protein YphA (DoxX/SURF4 family)